MNQRDIENMKKLYEAEMSESIEKPSGAFRETIKALDKDEEGRCPMVTVKIPRQNFKHFLKDRCDYAKEIQTRAKNPSVMEAWEHYQTLLALAK